MAKHLIRKWKGSRQNYNLLKSSNALDPWTIYYVVDTIDNKSTVVEYCGANIITPQTGQPLAVNDLLSELPSSGINPYDRYLVGTDATGYKIYEYTPIANSDSLSVSNIDFDWKLGVRILSKGLKNYVYYDGKLVTYDDVDCGLF